MIQGLIGFSNDPRAWEFSCHTSEHEGPAARVCDPHHPQPGQMRDEDVTVNVAIRTHEFERISTEGDRTPEHGQPRPHNGGLSLLSPVLVKESAQVQHWRRERERLPDHHRGAQGTAELTPHVRTQRILAPHVRTQRILGE